MNTTSRAIGPEADDRLDLPACPICHRERTLSRQQATLQGVDYVWYDCTACGSALLSLGDRRWAYQKVTRPSQEHLVGRPMTVADLRRLLPRPAPEPPVPTSTFGARAPATQPAPPSRRVEVVQAEPEPVVERDATGIEALRATLHVADEGVERPTVEAGEGDTGSTLPSIFIAGVLLLLVLLIAGLGLTLLVMFWPT